MKKIVFILFGIFLITNQIQAQETDSITDPRDGQTYDIVKIGNQWWMAENLNYGTMVDGSIYQSDDGTVEKYCYSNNETNCDNYGGLYQWGEIIQYDTIEGIQGICPDGWHIPTDEEWKTSEIHLGMSQTDADTTGWRGTDQGTQLKVGGSSGFEALLAGLRYYNNANFYDLGTNGYFWTSTIFDENTAWYRRLKSDSTQIVRGNPQNTYGFSVRCVKNIDTLAISLMGTDVTSIEGTDGSIDLTVSGGLSPYTFSWSNAETMEDISSLSAGVYSVTVTDARDSTATDSIRIYNTFVDERDAQVYKAVTIGDQIWMAENLKSTHYADGTPLVDGTGAGDITGDYTTKYYFWYDDDSATYADTYGALYTWAAAMNGEASSDNNPSGIQGVCPDGWHAPSDSEWKELEMYLGMSQAEADETAAWRGTDEGGKLKETGTTHWSSPNTGATNESGFTALPGGYRAYGGTFSLIYNDGHWWSATENDATHAWFRRLNYNSSETGRYDGNISLGFSVRCVKTYTLYTDSLALVALYDSTDGANWTDNSNWLDGNVLTWYGITVTNGRVTTINQDNNNLNGTIPLSIGDLDNLQILNLQENQLSGSLPAEIGNLVNLQSLAINMTQLTGSIPAEIGNLTNLTFLDFQVNQFTGSIPSEIGNLLNLYHLDLHGNQLSGTIPPEIGNLTNLQYLNFGDNQLTGLISSVIGNLINLKNLQLNNNQFSGSIPVEIGNLTNLLLLELYDNQFSGSIPSEIGNLTSLTSLWLSGNQLSGSIPIEIGNLNNLQNLHLAGNQLSGSIPSEIGNLINLTTLWLESNQLSGSIPTEIGNLTNLTVLSLFNNQLTGSIPPEISNLTNLTGLYLCDNEFTDLPDLSTLESLDYLSIENNQFTFKDIELNIGVASTTFTYSPQDSIGEIIDTTVYAGTTYTMSVSTGGASSQYQWKKDGTNIGTVSGDSTYAINPVAFSDTGAYTCEITNTVATDLTLYSLPINVSVRSLQEDSLVLVALYNSTNGDNWTNRGNWLTGELSTWYGISADEDGVMYIGLSQNNLIGTIPPEIGDLTNLIDLELYDNQLTGSIPSSIGNLNNLQNLDLNGNLLTGSIPAEIGNLISLQTLYLTNNQLTGSIPNEIGNLANLTEIELVNNLLSGSIPSAIGNLANLNRLDLSYNQFSGLIPPEIGNLTNLQTLILSYNQLSDTIPDEIGDLVNLELIDMEENQLSGTVPQTITNLINLQYLYLQYNQLSDLPDLSSLTSLLDLEIYENKFTFEDIEPNIGVPATDFYYAPQDNVGIEKTEKVAIDSSYTMSVETGGDNNLYQWYLNEELISGATDSSYTIGAVTQADYGEYICEITNTLATELTLYSRPIHLVTPGALSGVYIIGLSSPDFMNFTEAVDSLLSAGIAGPVIFNVESGTYNEQITIFEILGTSPANTVTFQSASGDSMDVILTLASDQAANNFIVKLDGADQITFRNMTLQATGTDWGRIIEIKDDANNNRFLNNQFIGIQTYIQFTEESSALIFSNRYCDDNVFISNKFQSGTVGIWKTGFDISDIETGTKIVNNEFVDQIFGSIKLVYQDAPIISGNLITADANDQEYRGIECSNCDNGIIIQKNRISTLNNYGGYGVFINNSDGTPGNEGLIANNFIHVTTLYHAYGIINNNSTYQNYYYNSVNMGINDNTRAMSVQTGSSDIVIKNNNFANWAYENSSTIECHVTSGITSDYNNLYTTGIELAYWGSYVTNLSDWQTTSGQDANSISVDPEFLSDSDLHTINKTLWAGTPIAEITDDIDGETRDAVKPFIGADEYVFIPNTENNILTYSFSEQTIKAIIDANNYTINIEVAYGTDVTNLVATFTLSELAIITVSSVPQESGVTANDFSAPVTYTVTAEDGTTLDWVVTVIQEQRITVDPADPYNEDFESGAGGWISGGNSSSWQYGTPDGTTIISAGPGNKAWVTNLTGDYNSDEVSYVKGPLFNLIFVPYPVIEFKIWWDAEGFYDGANLQYKQGTGAWKTLGTDEGDDNWYNSSYLYSIEKGFGFDINNSAGWSGDDEWGYGSNGWVTVSHALTSIDNQSDVTFRIAFASNSSYENDGVAIDDINIFTDPTGIDPFNALLSDIQIYPNPNEGKFRLVYNGERDVDLQLQLINIQGQVILSEQIETGYRFSKEFELEYLPPGIYYFRLMHKESVIVKKMVVR